jgi:hypothetical protein
MPGWRASAACFTILGALDLGSDEGAARAARAVSAARATKADHRTLTRIMLRLASQASGAARRRLEDEFMTFTYERDFIDGLVEEAADRAGEKGRIDVWFDRALTAASADVVFKN